MAFDNWFFKLRFTLILCLTPIPQIPQLTVLTFKLKVFSMRSLSISTPSSNIGPILFALFKHRHWLPRALLWVASFKCQLKLSSNISDAYLERISERLKDAIKSQTLLSRVSITLLEYFLSVPSPFFSQPRKNARSFFVALFICSRVTPGVGSK